MGEGQGSGGGGSRAPWWESLGRKGREKAGTAPQSPPPPLPCLSPTTLSLFPSRTSTFLEEEKHFFGPLGPSLT